MSDHLDSWLLVDFAKYLEKVDGIRVIDNESHATWGPATIENRFAIELILAGRLFDVRIVQICRAVQKAGAAPEFTVSMHTRKDK